MIQGSFLTVEEVAKRFGINTSTVYRLTQRGRLPGFKIGGQWRFSKEMLDSWITGRVNREQLETGDASS